MHTSPTESTRNAIELMTSWLESSDEPSELFIRRMCAHIGERPDGDPIAGAVELVMGMTQLCGSLLITLAEEIGVSESEALQGLALLYAAQD